MDDKAKEKGIVEEVVQSMITFSKENDISRLDTVREYLSLSVMNFCHSDFKFACLSESQKIKSIITFLDYP